MLAASVTGDATPSPRPLGLTGFFPLDTPLCLNIPRGSLLLSPHHRIWPRPYKCLLDNLLTVLSTASCGPLPGTQAAEFPHTVMDG